jgi:ABC-type multidrug transport system ATPase subunit
MPQGQVLEFSGATKRFGGVTAVSDFTARVEPGVVTGFLGPNGAGKTTSLRMLLGLVRPTAGSATIDGVRYAQLKNPLQTVGAVLEASSFHPGRTGAAHLSVYAKAGRIPKARVDEVLGLVGLSDAAGRKVGGYSLGMRQRLGLAYALLGDPGVLVLDEPTNGLDPEGIRWIRGFLRQLAREGRTVFVSSHLLAEVQQTVDALLIIAAGRLVFQGALEELADPAEQATVVDSADRAALAEALRAAGIPFEVLRSGLTVRGIEPVSVGLAAAAAGVPLSSLHKRGPALEEVFLDLVNGTRTHASASGALHDDVIPAIESGPISVIPAAEIPDAAPAPVADADEPAAAQEPVAAAVVAETTAADDTSAEEAPAPTAPVETAVEEAPADPAVEEAPEEAAPAETAPDADPAPFEGAPLEGAVEEAPAGAAVEDVPEEAAPGPRTAAFSVASTGVIDVIPPDEDEDGAGEPVEEAEQIDAAGEELATDEDVEDLVSDDDDRSWDEYVKTEADVEADRFFAAFDAEAEAGSEATEAPSPEHDPAEGEPVDGEPAGDEGSDLREDEGEPPQPPDEGEHAAGDEYGHHDHDGGEHR